MSEPVGTESIMTQLEAWASNDALIAPDRFACPHYGACNASVNQELREGKGCCMSYVGPQYGKWFRLAVVGMDHGDFELATFEERQRGILDYYIKGRNKFNPHYAGVVKTTAAVLGKSGAYCQNSCTESCEATNNEDCVINRIAQPNLVKCAPRHARKQNFDGKVGHEGQLRSPSSSRASHPSTGDDYLSRGSKPRDNEARVRACRN